MPPRNPLGVVSGVLKSPCASSHSTCTSGTWRTTAWKVVMQIEQSEEVRTGKRSGASACPRPGRRPRAGSRASRAGRRRSARPAARRACRPGARRGPAPAPAPRRRARRPRVRSDVRQRSAATLSWPVHTGSRFSKNAFTPSWMSSVENASVSCACRYSSASASAMSCWRYIASLPSRISSGDLAASLPAQSATAASNSSAGHDPVDDPDPLRLVRVDLLAQQQQLVGLLAPDVAVDQRHDHEREDPDVDLGRAEARALLGDDQVAGQREAERAREHVAVGGAQRRLAELADQLEQAREAVGGEVLVDRAAARPRSRRGRRRRRRPSRAWR